MPSFAEQLAAARKAAGLTQEDLAGAVHVSRTTISSWERGRTQPDLESLRILSQTLGCDFLSPGTGAQAAEEAAADAPEPEPLSETGAPAGERRRLSRRTAVILCAAALVIGVICFLCFALPAINGQKPESLSAPATAARNQSDVTPEETENPNLPPAAALNLSDLTPEEPEVLTPEWFRGGNLRMKGEPWLDIKTQVLVNAENQTEPFWRYILTFEEVTGRTFHFDQLDWYAFWALDNCEHRFFNAASGAVWEDDEGRSWEFIGGNPVQDMVGYGFIIRGHDDAGNEMTFRTFIDMTQAPRE